MIFERFSVRIRPLATLSLAAAAAVVLAGCSSAAPEPDASASGTAGDLCSAAASSGAASEAVSVEGEVGAVPTVSFDEPLEVSEVQRTVITEGNGEKASEGDYVSYALSAYDAATGEQIGTAGFTEGELLPTPLTGDSVLGESLGCATVGTRVVATLPAVEGSSEAMVYVLDLTGIVPVTATGADQAPPAGMPTVELDEDGQPTITVPDTEPPVEVQLATLKLGDGPEVLPGDKVMVQYRGVLWSDGTEFDSSWGRGAPASFVTNQVVPGFQQALEGQTVGSQVLVVVPPAAGYGDQAQGSIPAGSTLVFVVDILATQHPTAQ